MLTTCTQKRDWRTHLGILSLTASVWLMGWVHIFICIWRVYNTQKLMYKKIKCFNERSYIMLLLCIFMFHFWVPMDILALHLNSSFLKYCLSVSHHFFLTASWKFGSEIFCLNSKHGKAIKCLRCAAHMVQSLKLPFFPTISDVWRCIGFFGSPF